MTLVTLRISRLRTNMVFQMRYARANLCSTHIHLLSSNGCAELWSKQVKVVKSVSLTLLNRFQCQLSNDKIRYPIGKTIFAVNFPLKNFPATAANADIGSLKSLHNSFKYVCTTC